MAAEIKIDLGLANLKTSRDQIKGLTESLNDLNESVKEQADSFKSFKDIVVGAASAGAIFALTADKIQRNFQILGTSVKFSSGFVKTLTESLLPLNKGILGATISLGTLSAALGSVGVLLVRSENDVTRFIGKISIMASILTGGVAAGLALAIKSIADLSVALGTTLVDAAKQATERFIELQKRTFVYERTVTNFNKVFGDSIGNLSTYNNLIAELSQNTGNSIENLRASTTELVAAGSQFGLNRKQLEFLLTASVDYAEVAKTDVLQATLDLVAGINGASQSVLKYGIKLTEAAVSQKLLTKGIDFDKLNDFEKIQARLNVLMGQYAPVAGLAAASTTTLAGQQKLLKSNLDNLNAAFGEGAAIIESNGLFTLGLNAILNNINTTVAKTTGFFTAFAGRFLQVGGIALSVSFQILAVVKAVNLLDAALQTDLLKTAFGRSIPLLNKSLLDLIKGTGAAFVDLSTTKNVLKTFGSSVIATFTQILSVISGVPVAGLTMTNFFKGAFVSGLKLAATAVTTLGKALLTLAFNPITIKIALIVGGIYLLFKALQAVDEKTGLLTKAFNLITTPLRFLGEAAGFFSKALDGIAKSIKELADKAFGLLVFAITKVIEAFVKTLQLIVTLASKISFISSAIGGELPAGLEGARGSLNGLTESLKSVDFQFSKTKEAADALAETFTKKFDFDAFKKLREELGKVGAATFAQAKKERDDRLSLLNDALRRELVKRKEFNDLRLKIEEDFQNKVQEIQDKEEERINRRFKLISNAASNLTRTFTQIFSGKGGEALNLGAAAGIGQNIVRGAEGARGLFGNVAGAVCNKLVPGSGELIGPLSAELSKGKEAAKAFVTEFTNAIPDMILGLVDGIAAAAVTFVDQVPLIIQRFVDGLPQVIQNLIEAMPRVAVALALQMPTVAFTFATSLIEQAPNIAQAIIKAIGNAPGNAAKSVGRIFRFAGGGTVPAGYGSGPSERFPALLGSGELTVDRSDTYRLRNFLDAFDGAKVAKVLGGEENGGTSKLLEMALSQPIILKMDNREIARGTRRQLQGGFVL